MLKGFVRAGRADDVDALCTLLHTKMNARIPVEHWRRLFTYRWMKDKPDHGRVVEADGQVLGYCGMVYSDRMIGDASYKRPERMVSMSSWYLDKSLRGQGLGREMLLSSIADPTLTYATLTNSKKPLGIVEGLGFEKLEDHRYLWRKQSAKHSGVIVTKEIDVIKARIDADQQQLIEDMSAYALTPLLAELDGQITLLFFSIKQKAADVLWFDLMYASDQSLFVRCAQALADQLLPDVPSVLASDGRFVKDPPAGAFREPLSVGRYYVSKRVYPHEIDHLYSELQLLDLKLD